MVVRKKRDLHVLAHAHRAERLRDLERAPDAKARDAVRRQAGNARFPDQDLARIRDQLAVQQVEAGGLAGAVRPDERDHLARLERKDTLFTACTPP